MTNEERVKIFKNEKIAVNCETIEEAKYFIKWCCANGFELQGTKSNGINFSNYKDRTCYNFGYLGINCFGYFPKHFFKEAGYEIIKFNDFMKEEKKMTRLEYVVSKNLSDERNTLCYIAHICKYGVECGVKGCLKCEFYKDINLCVQTLLGEHKEHIKLKQWEYDLLKAGIETYGRHHFSWHKYLCNMKNKGYFKNITDISMPVAYILDNCEIVADDYDFGSKGE